MDFDNLQSVSSVSDTLPYEAVSITGRDCFWDGSVPNPLEMSVGSPTMSVSSNIPEPSGARARVGGLADPVSSRPKVGIPTFTSCPYFFLTSEHCRVFFYGTWFGYGFEPSWF